MSRQSQTSNFASGDWLIGAVKNNPEGLLLLAAGCALLLRSSSGSSARAAPGSSRHQRPRGPNGRFQSDGSGDWNVGEEVSRTAGNAQESASGVTSRVSETASAYASSAADYASSAASSAAGYAADYMDQARRTVSEQSGRFARQASSTLQDTINRVVQEQPFAVALAGLAAGAAIAAAFPATEIEKRTLGPTGERITEAAGQFRDQLREGTARAGEQLKSAAEERDLNAEGVKEVAREAASAFGSAFSSGQPGQSDSSSASRGPSPAGGTDQESRSGPSQRNPGGKRGA